MLSSKNLQRVQEAQSSRRSFPIDGYDVVIPSTLVTGSFVPFTIVAACSTDIVMRTEDVRFDWAEFLLAERTKEGTTAIAFELIAVAALVDGARREKYDSGTFSLAC
jgi:hypothetical protein